MERQKDRTLKDELPQVGRYPIYYWRRAGNSSRPNEEAEPKQKQYPVVDVSGGKSKV